MSKNGNNLGVLIMGANVIRYLLPYFSNLAPFDAAKQLY